MLALCPRTAAAGNINISLFDCQTKVHTVDVCVYFVLAGFGAVSRLDAYWCASTSSFQNGRWSRPSRQGRKRKKEKTSETRKDMPAAHSMESGNGTGPDGSWSSGITRPGVKFACGRLNEDGSRCCLFCGIRNTCAWGRNLARNVHGALADPSPAVSSRSLKPLLEISCFWRYLAFEDILLSEISCFRKYLAFVRAIDIRVFEMALLHRAILI